MINTKANKSSQLLKILLDMKTTPLINALTTANQTNALKAISVQLDSIYLGVSATNKTNAKNLHSNAHSLWNRSVSKNVSKDDSKRGVSNQMVGKKS